MHLKHVPAPVAMAGGGTKGCLHCHQNHQDTRTRKSGCFFMVGRWQRKNRSSSTSREQRVNPPWRQQPYSTQQWHHTADAFISCPLPLFLRFLHLHLIPLTKMMKETEICYIKVRWNPGSFYLLEISSFCDWLIELFFWTWRRNRYDRRKDVF